MSKKKRKNKKYLNSQNENSPVFPQTQNNSTQGQEIVEHRYLHKDLIVILVLTIFFLIVLLVIYYLSRTTDLINNLSNWFLSSLISR